jgi:hypothetical protein
MTIHAKGPPPEHGGDPLEELSSYGGVDLQANSPAPAQADNGASEITCASMRADELRGCLIREIFRAALIGIQAQAALLDSDDGAAIANLRRHWIATHTGIAPLAGELLALRKEGQ